MDTPGRLDTPICREDGVFRLSLRVVMEAFDEGALVLRLEDRHLFELNPTAHFVLAQSDGECTVLQVAIALAEAFHIPEREALADTLALYAQLFDQGIVETVGSRPG